MVYAVGKMIKESDQPSMYTHIVMPFLSADKDGKYNPLKDNRRIDLFIKDGELYMTSST